MDFIDLISKCDTLIKAGKIAAVAALVGKLNLARVPREHRQALAKICRRSGLIDTGLRLLYPIIRHERELEEPARPGEVCEYSVLLSRNGSIAEALDLLNAVDAAQTHEALLYRGFCHISGWEYERAIPELESFLASPADSYSKLIARVNLASSYLATGRIERAIPFLSETIDVARSASAARLAGNCLELRGQAHVLSGDYTNARADLASALEVFGQTQSYDQLLILKWQAVMAANEAGSIEPLIKFRGEALARKHWESVREADLFALKIEFDPERFDRLVIGTAAGSYRARIRQLISREPNLAYTLGDPAGRVIDLATGGGDLNAGKKIHQALRALTRDFYSPRNLGTLFAELYPREYFNAESSPTRVRQILKRTRRWLEEAGFKAEIVSEDGGYRFAPGPGLAMRVPLEMPDVASPSLRWEELKKAFPEGQRFLAREACEKLKMSSSSFHRLIEWARESGELEVTGVGKATRYAAARAKLRAA